MAQLDWLVVRDLNMIESATFWKDAPEIETGELTTTEIETEVFFFPAASHVEKGGTFTQTQRMLQWHHKAVDPPGDAQPRELHAPRERQPAHAARRRDPRLRREALGVAGEQRAPPRRPRRPA